VLDTLFELDGKPRNVHSGVDREDAIRVREILFAQPLGTSRLQSRTRPGGPQTPGTRIAAGAGGPLGFLDSAVDEPRYMPLFVSPQPVETGKVRDEGSDDAADDGDDSDDSDDSDEDDDDQDQAGRTVTGAVGVAAGAAVADAASRADPTVRARRRCRESDDDVQDSDDDGDQYSDDGDDDENGSSEAGNRRRRRRRRVSRWQ